MTNKYDISEHIHRYAVWTAARSQRAFAKNKVIQDVLESTELREFCSLDRDMKAKEFDEKHMQICEAIIKGFEDYGFTGKKECKYGRAAKLMAIYIKTVAVLPNQGNCNLSKVAHPPIDSILLRNLWEKKKISGIKNLKWTKLEKDDYFDLIVKLRKVESENFWEIEEFWEIE